MEFNNTNHTLQVGEEITVPSDETHVVYTVSESPSCWMYIFMNTTEWNNETIRNWILHPGKPLHQGIGVKGYVNKSMLMNNNDLIPPFMNRNCPTEENSFQEGHDPLGKV